MNWYKQVIEKDIIIMEFNFKLDKNGIMEISEEAKFSGIGFDEEYEVG